MMIFKYPNGATPLDMDEAAELIPDHIMTQEELNAWEHKNILMGQIWAKKKKDIVSEHFIRDLHRHMFDKTWKWAGIYRKSQKSIGVEWLLITGEIKKLCDDVIYQIENQSFPVDEIALRFHHRLVLIHPFPNGNGRLSRLIADLLIKQLGEPKFSWGSNIDLYKSSSARDIYIKALRCADSGDYSLLLKFARS